MVNKHSFKDFKETAVNIYRFILTENKPVGVREIARELELSSPSVAQHHLSRLEDAGLIQQQCGKYVIKKVVLQSNVKINRFLIPRPVFYLIFVIIALILECIICPPLPMHVYFVATFINIILMLICVYEIVRVYRTGRL